MGMKKERMFLRIWMGIFVLLISAGLYFWGVHFNFGMEKQNIPGAVSQKIIDQQFSGLENITWKIFVSPINSYDNYAALVKNTKTHLFIQTYDFTEKKVKDLFVQLLNKGIQIKCMLENKKFQQFADTFAQVKSYFSGYAGFSLISDEHMKTEYLHSKITLMDSGFFIHTANLTHTSFFANREYLLYSQNIDVLHSLEHLFSNDWEGKDTSAAELHPNLVVCNINCRPVIQRLLNTASGSIIIETQYITDPALMKILQSKIALPEVKLLVSDTASNDEVLKYFGPKVAKRLTKPYVHAKMILIDHKIMLLGSMNLSANSLDSNREIGILLLDPLLINQFYQQFAEDRAQGKGKY